MKGLFMEKSKGFKIKVTVYYALIMGECGCEHHCYHHRTMAQSSLDAVVEAMKRVKAKEAPMLANGKRIYWEHADWAVPYSPLEKGREKLTIFNVKGLSEIIK